VASKTPVASAWYDADFVRRAPQREFPASEPRTRSAHTRALYREVRSRYNVHCLEWQNKVAAMFGLESAFPFLDRDLIGFLIGVPGDVMIRDGVPKATLRAGLQGVVPSCILQRADKADFTAVVNDAFTQDAAAIARVLARGLGTARGFVDAGALTVALAEAQTRLAGTSGTASHEITDLVGLELWLGAFFDGETA
jgi:asparagine synthetase B (glutamine-hydrolysing)